MPLHLSITTRTDVGRVRSRNEDSVAADPERGIVVVADGMGGHPGGDVASRLAAAEATRRLVALASDSKLPGNLGEPMAEAVRAADEVVRQEGRQDPAKSGMGTTLTAILVDQVGGRFVVGHVGDSRAYRVRKGALELLTRDDTWVQTQVDAGRLTTEQARHHPWSSVLSQAIGLDRPARPALVEGRVKAGDLYLLCSDGLVAMLSDEEVEQVVRKAMTDGIEAVADALVAAANDAGGVDNVTVGLVALTQVA